MEVQGENFYTGKDEYLSIMFSRWQKFHIATLFFALLFSVIGFLTFMSFVGKFYPHCPLSSKIKIGIDWEYGKRFIDHNRTRWGKDINCNFVFYTPIAQLLAALIGLLLFLSQSGQSNLRGGFRNNSQMRLIPPTGIIGLLMACTSLSAAMVLTFGGSDFCKNIENQLENCSDIESLGWKKKSKLRDFQLYLKGAQISYWLTTHAFLTHAVMAIFRWNTNVDYVIAEERELRENPNFLDIMLQDMEQDKDTLRSVSLYAKQK